MAENVTIGQLPLAPVGQVTDEVEIERPGDASYRLALSSVVDLVDTTVAWGEIGGILSNQTDLQNALDTKLEDAPIDGSLYGRQDGLWAVVDTSVVWGDIGGTLSNQTDLQNALDAKAPIANPVFTGSFTSPGIDDNASSTALTIDSSQNVGIGDNDPLGRLDISADTGCYLNLDSVTSGPSAINMLGTGSLLQSIGYEGNLRLGSITGKNLAGFTEFVRLDSSGNFGIGTTPSYRFDVSGVSGGATQARVASQAGQNVILRINSGDSVGDCFLYMGALGAEAAYGRVQYDSGAHRLGFWANNAEAMRIDSSQNIQMSSLAGTGTRDVQVLADGTLIAV